MADVYSALASGRFTVADFNVSMGDSDSNLLFVEFDINREYFLLVGDSNDLFVRMSPGAHRATDVIALTGLDSVPMYVKQWVKNVYSEMRATLPAVAEIDELKKALDAHLASHAADPSEHFSVAEASEMQAKLDAVVVELERLKERDEITQKQLDTLTKEMERLKDELAYFPKRTWYRAAGTKLWSVLGGIAKSKEGQKLAADLARKAIGLDG